MQGKQPVKLLSPRPSCRLLRYPISRIYPPIFDPHSITRPPHGEQISGTNALYPPSFPFFGVVIIRCCPPKFPGISDTYFVVSG